MFTERKNSTKNIFWKFSDTYDVIDDVINSKNIFFSKIATNHNFWPILMILDGFEANMTFMTPEKKKKSSEKY